MASKSDANVRLSKPSGLTKPSEFRCSFGFITTRLMASPGFQAARAPSAPISFKQVASPSRVLAVFSITFFPHVCGPTSLLSCFSSFFSDVPPMSSEQRGYTHRSLINRSLAAGFSANRRDASSQKGFRSGSHGFNATCLFIVCEIQ